MSKVGVVQSRGCLTHITPAGGEDGTALQAVSHQGNLEIVTLLLKKGADPNVQGGSCAIPMISNSHYTCRWQARHSPSSSIAPGKSGHCDTAS
jgi:hypothetical protein